MYKIIKCRLSLDECLIPVNTCPLTEMIAAMISPQSSYSPLSVISFTLAPSVPLAPPSPHLPACHSLLTNSPHLLRLSASDHQSTRHIDTHLRSLRFSTRLFYVICTSLSSGFRTDSPVSPTSLLCPGD